MWNVASQTKNFFVCSILGKRVNPKIQEELREIDKILFCLAVNNYQSLVSLLNFFSHRIKFSGKRRECASISEVNEGKKEALTLWKRLAAFNETLNSAWRHSRCIQAFVIHFGKYAYRTFFFFCLPCQLAFNILLLVINRRTAVLKLIIYVTNKLVFAMKLEQDADHYEDVFENDCIGNHD